MNVGQPFRKVAWIRKCFGWETTKIKLNIFSFQPEVKNTIGGNVVRFLFLIQAQHTT